MELRAVGAEADRRVLECLRVDDVRESVLRRDRHSRPLLGLGRLPGVDDRVLPPRADDERAEPGAGRPVAVRQQVVGVDDVRLDAPREPGEGGSHPEAPHERHAQQRIEILELVDDEAVELALARVDAAGRDVHLVPALCEPGRPAGEVARLRVADAEDAK